MVPSIVQLELAKWLMRETSEEKADQVSAFSKQRVVVDLDTRLALAAADACGHYKLVTADAVIYAAT